MTIMAAARVLIAALSLILAGGAMKVSAQATSRPGAESQTITPEKIKAARDLLAVTNADAQFTTVIPLMFDQMRRTLPSPGPNQQQQIDEVFNEIEKQFVERRGEVLDQIAVLYARKFSAEEMNALSDFYRTPVGQKFIAAMPQLATEAMTLGNAWGQKIAREAEQKIRQELQRRGLKL